MGGFPPKAALVAAAMGGRILVVDSQPKSLGKSPVNSSVKMPVESPVTSPSEISASITGGDNIDDDKELSSQQSYIDRDDGDDGDDGDEGDEGDEWGYTACDEMARLYRVGPVIRLIHDDDVDGEDDCGSVDDDDDDNVNEQGLVERPDQELESGLLSSFHTLTWRDIDNIDHPSQIFSPPSQISTQPSENVVLSKKRRRQLQSASYVQVISPLFIFIT